MITKMEQQNQNSHSIKTLIFAILLAFYITPAYAVLKIDITQGNVEPLSIAIAEFQPSQSTSTKFAAEIHNIVKNDLTSSGIFSVLHKATIPENVGVNEVPEFSQWTNLDVSAILTGEVANNNDEVAVTFRLWDPIKEEQIEGKKIRIRKTQYRRLGHKIADIIYKNATGEEGFFDTRIAFISESGSLKRRIKKLAVMDQDGVNYIEISTGKNLVLTPRFANKSHHIVYMSYRNEIPKVYMLNLKTAEQKLIGEFQGMSFAPRFSPDDKHIIMSIANNGTTGIYEYSLTNKTMKKLNARGGTISTSPSYSSDGKRIVFSSDRGGSSQLYVMNRNGLNPKRISFDKGSYSTPIWSPRGDFIAFTKAIGGQFYIGVMRPDGSGERLLTSSWMDESPTWSPNGRVIMFARQAKGGGNRIYAVDITGYNQRLVNTPKDASDPAWSILLD